MTACWEQVGSVLAANTLLSRASCRSRHRPGSTCARSPVSPRPERSRTRAALGSRPARRGDRARRDHPDLAAGHHRRPGAAPAAGADGAVRPQGDRRPTGGRRRRRLASSTSWPPGRWPSTPPTSCRRACCRRRPSRPAATAAARAAADVEGRPARRRADHLPPRRAGPRQRRGLRDRRPAGRSPAALRAAAATSGPRSGSCWASSSVAGSASTSTDLLRRSISMLRQRRTCAGDRATIDRSTDRPAHRAARRPPRSSRARPSPCRRSCATPSCSTGSRPRSPRSPTVGTLADAPPGAELVPYALAAAAQSLTARCHPSNAHVARVGSMVRFGDDSLADLARGVSATV